MKKLNRKIRILFFASLALSIGFPLGILGIIFGAVYFIVPLLVVGVVLTAVGFYSIPLMWLKYSDLRGDRVVLFMIENEHIYTVAGLARQTGYSDRDVRERIKRLILSHSLTGYLFQEDTLTPNTNQPPVPATPPVKQCVRCGADMLYRDGVYFCEYCLYEESRR